MNNTTIICMEQTVLNDDVLNIIFKYNHEMKMIDIRNEFKLLYIECENQNTSLNCLLGECENELSYEERVEIWENEIPCCDRCGKYYWDEIIKPSFIKNNKCIFNNTSTNSNNDKNINEDTPKRKVKKIKRIIPRVIYSY
jgi:hypothetical protein